VIGIGVVGLNYGKTVLVPAFRADPRCRVVALAGTDVGRARELAGAAQVPRAHGGWRALVEDGEVGAVAVAVPPARQPEIACHALALGKPVFAEKPLAADVAGAEAMLACARAMALPTMIDFNFPELPTWRRAKALLQEGAIGRLRHALVTWNVENPATRLGLESWKTRGEGGGVLGNFVSHSFYYLEWLCGPITGLCGRGFTLPGRATDGGIALALELAGGAGGCLQMSCGSFLGSGHRLELYGDDGTLVLASPGPDYFRGFELRHGTRSDPVLRPVAAPADEAEPDPAADSRIAPVTRLVHRFLDACESGGRPAPGFAEGLRVQQLIEAARQAHAQGRFVAVAPQEQTP
jgi:predicted dehydrogenase